MRYRVLISALLAASFAAGCGSGDSSAKSTTTPAAATSSATAVGGAYAADARTLLNDLGTAQRALADAITASAPLSDAWKQAVSTRVAAFAALEDRAQKLSPPSGQQASQAQLLLAARRSREAADAIATAVSEGNVSMLERANSVLADAVFQTTAAVATLPR